MCIVNLLDKYISQWSIIIWHEYDVRWEHNKTFKKAEMVLRDRPQYDVDVCTYLCSRQ